MFTCASPPYSRLTSTSANRKSFSVIPAAFIRLPTKMNTGTATSGKLSSAYSVRCATVAIGMPSQAI